MNSCAHYHGARCTVRARCARRRRARALRARARGRPLRLCLCLLPASASAAFAFSLCARSLSLSFRLSCARARARRFFLHSGYPSTSPNASASCRLINQSIVDQNRDPPTPCQLISCPPALALALPGTGGWRRSGPRAARCPLLSQAAQRPPCPVSPRAAMSASRSVTNAADAWAADVFALASSHRLSWTTWDPKQHWKSK